MSIRIMSLVFGSSKTKLAARLVLLALADNASDEGYCYPSIATIARKACLSEVTTGEYMQAFVKIGLVTRAERFNTDGKQTSNGYTIQTAMIGNDEITTELMDSCRPASKVARGGITRLPPRQHGDNPLTPTPPKPLTPESSVKPSSNNSNRSPLKTATELYEQNIGEATPLIVTGIERCITDYPAAWFESAMIEAVDNEIRKLSYIESILARWKVDGFQTKFTSKASTKTTPRPPAPRKGQPTPAAPRAPIPEPEFTPAQLAQGARIVARQRAQAEAQRVAQGAVK